MFNNQTILITGGTGSFGKQFTRMLLDRYNPKRIIIFSRDELKQHDMRMAFNNDERLRFFIGDLRDRERVYRAFSTEIDLVVHAAALKQVPACEYNPYEAVKTNVIGGQNVIDAAIDCGIPKVIALSTDKAVNPINLYGATKLCAEKLFIQGNSYAGRKDTRFSCVRYGNVVGSRGSVVPVFRTQRETGVVTVTDERMTRFWITLEQAVEFVFNAAQVMVGGETFIPRLPSMGIMDLVKVIAPDCDVQFTGIRPGEKLHEILISEDEARHTVELKDMLVILPEYPWWDKRHQETSAYKGGTPLAEGTCYASNTNDWWLTQDELRQMVGE
ncbi:MAG: UDP-N-acetylglucosamine 4,6-dehydratase (inverting) [Anaerolineae bacterium]|jgi:UDP-N-acetylglucosamine 4,6-dehydratase|nr:UDP-N-acetylglucosamine 4,6-dehydratase (inverting) [Anaerolineae bacterium]